MAYPPVIDPQAFPFQWRLVGDDWYIEFVNEFIRPATPTETAFIDAIQIVNGGKANGYEER